MSEEEMYGEIYCKSKHFKIEYEVCGIKTNVDLVETKFYINLLKRYCELQQENKQLKEQLQQRDSVIQEAIEKCELEISASSYHLERRFSRSELNHKVAHKRILYILSKYKNEDSEDKESE